MNQSTYIFDATAENFQQCVIENSHKVPVLVDFWAEWCEPCKILMPLLDKLVNDYAGEVILAKVNSEQQQQLSTEYGVRSIPMVKIFRHGEIVNEFTGVKPEDQIKSLIERYLSTAADKLRDQALDQIRQGELEKGRELLEQAAAEEPRNTSVHIDLAHLDAEKGDYQAATDRLKSLGQEAMNKVEVTSLLSKMEFAMAAASVTDVNSLKQQVEAEPKNSAARYQLAAHYALGGDYQPALEQLLQILTSDRKYNDDAGRRGMLAIFSMLGDDELVTSYRRKMFNAMH